MLTIDRMRLNLPEGFDHRGERIGRLVAHKLAVVSLKTSLQIEKLSVPPVQVHPAFTDEQVAHRVAMAIYSQLGKSES
jgi:hypothetical protein